jgi:hypothetical protein
MAPPAQARVATGQRTQRELVIASLLRCPPRTTGANKR